MKDIYKNKRLLIALLLLVVVELFDGGKTSHTFYLVSISILYTLFFSIHIYNWNIDMHENK